MEPVKAHIGGDIAITTAPSLLHWNDNNNRNCVSSFPGNIIMLIQRKSIIFISINVYIYFLDVISDLNLRNWMWFSVVCTLTYNSLHHYSFQNVVDSLGAAEKVHNNFWTKYNSLPQCQRQRKRSFWERDQDRDKERASVLYNFLAIWLVYCPKWAFQIGYYNKKELFALITSVVSVWKNVLLQFR